MGNVWNLIKHLVEHNGLRIDEDAQETLDKNVKEEEEEPGKDEGNGTEGSDGTVGSTGQDRVPGEQTGDSGGNASVGS